jgi:hypothetical protein
MIRKFSKTQVDYYITKPTRNYCRCGEYSMKWE